jgi:hypothetical protein
MGKTTSTHHLYAGLALIYLALAGIPITAGIVSTMPKLNAAEDSAFF